MGVPTESVKNMLNAACENADERLAFTFGLIEEPDLNTWPPYLDAGQLLRAGIYSPVQLVVHEIAQGLAVDVEREFPFHFSLVAMLVQKVLESHNDPNVAPADTKGKEWHRYRHLCQTVFHLREFREEGERLSLEIALPHDVTADPATVVDGRILGQVFGRGVSLVAGPNLANRTAPEGYPDYHFSGHDDAPASQIYRFDNTFKHLKEQRRMSIILRRDGHITLVDGRDAIGGGNPILEFYDGGWHVVDLTAGRQAYEILLQAMLGTPVDSKMAGALIQLAYHMATHWHGGIIAVVRNPEQLWGGDLEVETETSAAIRKLIKQLSGVKGARIQDLSSSESGMGRLLLTCAIQDGALIFGPEGTLHAVGAMTGKPKAVQRGGAGTRAAKGLGVHGVAMKISHDGAIRIFAGEPGELVPTEGLRIH